MKMERRSPEKSLSSRKGQVEKSPNVSSSWVSSCNTRLNADDLKTLMAEETIKLGNLEERKEIAEGNNESVRKQEALSLFEGVHKVSAKIAALKIQGAKILKDKLPTKIDRPDIYSAMDDVCKLESASAYLTVSKYLKDSSEMMEANLASGLHSEAVDVLQVMIKIQEQYVKVTCCANIKHFVTGTVKYWENVLRNKFQSDFEKTLETFGWPSKLAATPSPTLDCQKKLHGVVHSLIRLTSLQLQVGNSSEDNGIPLLKDFQGNILPIKIMIQPLKKRFYFHFFTNKVTNDPRRPEWYFTQIKSWLRQLTPFVKSHLEITVTELGMSSVQDFAVQLSALLLLKANSQLMDGTEVEDGVFAKILEESIVLENEIASLLNDDASQSSGSIPPIVSTLFSQPQVLQRWLNIEKKVCLEKMDDLFASPTAWTRAVFPGPTEVADLFLALLRFVTDRFAYLRHQSDRVTFLQLLVELIDDFRVRCLQTWTSKQPIAAEYHDEVLIDYIIADTLHTVRSTLESWEDLPFFAALSAYLAKAGEECDTSSSSIINRKRREENSSTAVVDDEFDDNKPEDAPQVGSPSQGVFFNVLDLYGCLLDTMLSSWCDAVVSNLRSNINKDYSSRKWHMFPANGFQENGETLSETILPTVQCLKAVCAGVSMSMNPTLSQNWIKRLAIEFDEMMMKAFVYRNRFTSGAISQVKFDMVYGIFPIFADCKISTSLFLVGINSALRVWEMQQGKALLLRDTLKDANATYEFREDTLAELEISLTPSDVIRLLQSRIDLEI